MRQLKRWFTFIAGILLLIVAFVAIFYDAYIIAFSSLITGVLMVISCIEKGENVIKEEREIKTVLLMEREDDEIFDETVILLDDEYFLIKTQNSYYMDMDWPCILEMVVDDKTGNPSYSDKYGVLAYLLDKGYCYIYDKRNEVSIKQVIVKLWSCTPRWDVGFPAGVGGRRFYIGKNVLFIQTHEWIS